MLAPTLSKKCKRFILSQWGKKGLDQLMERPVSWTLYQANPQLKQLRRTHKGVPLIAVKSTPNRILLALSTEKKEPSC